MKSSTTKQTPSNGAKKNGTATAKSNTSRSSAAKSGTDKKSRGEVSESSSAASGLKDFFEDSLKDIYWAEKALTKALAKMAKNATSEELTTALNDHLSVTEEHVTRLEQVFEILEQPARAKKCEAMEGLIKEGEGIMEETEKGPVRDAGIIAACQKVEHYEIATYGTLVTHAGILGEDEIVDILRQTLDEEKEADSTLTGVAETINFEAADENESEEEEE